MTTGAVAPELSPFRALARAGRVVPVTRRLLADGETPVGVYRKLAGGRPGTFLLESAEHGRSWSRWSLRARSTRSAPPATPAIAPASTRTSCRPSSSAGRW